MSQGGLFELRGVTKSYDDVAVLCGVDLEVPAHRVTVLLGENGSGKSILMKMLVGLIAPDEGDVRMGGHSVPHMSREQLTVLRKDTSYMFQSGALFDSMTVEQNIGYGLREHTSLGDNEIRARALQCLELVGLRSSIIDEYPAQLSGGMRKRVSVARAIATQPKVVLYDEPTGGLDPQNVTRIGELILALQRELSLTSVVITHDLELAFQIGDLLVLIDEGRVAWQGTAAEFRTSDDPLVREFLPDELRLESSPT